MRDGVGFVLVFQGLVFSVACRVEHTLVFGATCGIGFVGGCGIGHTLPFGSTCGTGFRNGYGRSTLCGFAVKVWHGIGSVMGWSGLRRFGPFWGWGVGWGVFLVVYGLLGTIYA